MELLTAANNYLTSVGFEWRTFFTGLAVCISLLSLLSLYVTYRTNKRSLILAEETAEQKRRQTVLEIDIKLIQAWEGMGGDYESETVSTSAGKAELNKAKKIIDQCLILNERYASTHYHLGLYFLLKKQYEKAESAYLLAIEIDPEHARSHYNLGILLNDTNRIEEAEAAYLEAIRIDPEHALAHNNLDILLRNKENSKV